MRFEDMRCSRRIFFKDAAALALAISARRACAASDEAAELLRKRTVTGAAITLISGGQAGLTQVFGKRNLEEALDVERGTVFEAASLSKPAFAYAVLGLVTDGKLKLDEPLLPYLKSHFSDDPRAAKITARMILSHTSGLPHGVADGAPINLQSDPGGRFAYSATGFTMLQRAVAGITGQTLEAFMRERMLGPLQMDRSEFLWREDFAKNWAAGYDKDGKRGINYIERFRKFSPSQLAEVLAQFPELAYPPAAAGLYTTASDYAKFLIRMLSTEAPAEMFKAQIKVTDEVSWGLGWGLLKSKQQEWIWHWGNWNGLSQHFVALNRETRNGIVILTNSGNGLRFCLDYVPRAIGLELEAVRKFVL